MTFCYLLILSFSTDNFFRFIVETRKSTAELYPSATLHELLCGLLRYMRSKNPFCPNFLDKKGNRLKPLQGTLDSYFHRLHSERVGRKTKQAEIITSNEEEQLWMKGVMTTTSTTGLQNATLFVVGKMFWLQGAMYLPKISTGHHSPASGHSYSGTTLFFTRSCKTSVPILGYIFVVDIFVFCVLQLRKVTARSKRKRSILRSTMFTSDTTYPWYTSIPLGKHALQSKLKNVCRGWNQWS